MKKTLTKTTQFKGYYIAISFSSLKEIIDNLFYTEAEFVEAIKNEIKEIKKWQPHHNDIFEIALVIHISNDGNEISLHCSFSRGVYNFSIVFLWGNDDSYKINSIWNLTEEADDFLKAIYKQIVEDGLWTLLLE